jgi:hypothetical protein
MNAITKTPEHTGIYAALAAAQAAMGPALKQAVNPAFKSKYADLASVMDACLPALTANGICVMQPTGEDELGRFVKTILAHTSGETVECRVPLIVSKNDMQGYGSAVTYARRYGLMSMAGIAPEDDDGNAAAKAPPKEEPKRTNTAAEAIGDAWRDAVLDGLPVNATPRQKADAFAEAIIADFKAVTGDRALSNRWTRHESMIDRFKMDYPDLFDRVAEAFDLRVGEIGAEVVAAK